MIFLAKLSKELNTYLYNYYFTIILSVKARSAYLGHLKRGFLLIQNQYGYNFPMDRLINSQKTRYLINKVELPDQNYKPYLVYCCVTIVC